MNFLNKLKENFIIIRTILLGTVIIIVKILTDTESFLDTLRINNFNLNWLIVAFKCRQYRELLVFYD